jgi:hypothetical protein
MQSILLIFWIQQQACTEYILRGHMAGKMAETYDHTKLIFQENEREKHQEHTEFYLTT